ncbi:glycosyltransferase [Rhizorhabdus argentea]|uniref:glycosyltransferase n=1 Tax=Rhizorhabdus argentea TaxID=1387174 RepID=UPI0030EE652A
MINIASLCFALLVFLHPYTTYPLSLWLFRARDIRRGSGGVSPSLTLMFSAYNEEKSLPEKISNIRAIKSLYPDIQVIAYCDLSSDRTLELLEEANDVLEVVAAMKRTGKATGMARMAAQARGDVCVFTDANVILDPQSIPTLRSYFTDPKIGGLAGSLHYTNDDASATARVGGLYWRLDEKLKALESRCGSIMGADGSIFAIRRELYPQVPPHLLDDMTVSMAVPLSGLRLVFAPDVIAYEKNTTLSADEFRRKRRIACRAFNTHLHLWPAIREEFGPADLYKYLSHKVVRWFGILPLLAVVTCAMISLLFAKLYLAIAGLLSVAAAVAGLGFLGISPFSVLLQILFALIATFYGVLDSWRGQTYQTWTPAQSRS